jgi:hypothetical protein
MTSRSANAAIKGYFYQFDHTIVQLLRAPTPNTSITVEGIEDMDVEAADEDSLIQCKYYEGTDYNHSVIKDAVVQMLRHFGENDHTNRTRKKYQIHGHFKDGQDKLPAALDLPFLKKHLLTFKEKEVARHAHIELNLSDTDLAQFLSTLTINIHGKSYEAQQLEVESLLKSHINSADSLDLRLFYYPLAINAIQTLAVQKSETDRSITKSEFLKKIGKKDVVFSSWLEQKFGHEYYAKSVKRRYFQSATTKLACSARIFVFNVGKDPNLGELRDLLTKLGLRYSHKELKRTPAHDRFCPYVLIPEATPDEMAAIKRLLMESGILIHDGYPFLGSQFSPELLAAPPSSEALYKIKFIPSAGHLLELRAKIKKMPVELFEFYRLAPNPTIPSMASVKHHQIRADSIEIIKEMIQ